MLGLFGPEVVQFIEMSGSRLTFLSSRAKKPGTAVKVRMTLVGYKTNRVDIPLNVVNCQPGAGGKGHLCVGALEMAEEHLYQLEDLLYSYAVRPDQGEAARRSPRLTISLKTVSRDLPGYNCVTVDISRHGVRLSCHGSVRQGALVNLAMETDLAGVQNMTLCGRVVWCREVGGKSKGHQLGVDFVGLTSVQMETLEYFTKMVAGRNRGDVMHRQIADGELTAHDGGAGPAIQLPSAPPPPGGY